MIIGYDAKRAFRNSRGLGNYSRNTIRLMESLYPENEYKLFTSKHNPELFNPDETDTKIILPSGWINKNFSSYWRTTTICNDIKKNGIELYHGLSQELPFGIKKTGVRTVVTAHDAIFMRYPKLYDPFYRKIFACKNRYACNVADRIVAISEQTKRDMMEFFDAGEQKIEVVYQGCDNSFRRQLPDGMIDRVKSRYNLPQQFLLTVGAIEKRKNQGFIVEALHKGKLDIPLVIVGKPVDCLQDIEKKIINYSLEKQIIILNNVPASDLPAMYHAALCMIYPSMFEGFGLPVLEALCTGTPVITTRGGCFEETGGAAALYVNPVNVDEMIEAIQRVCCDAQLRNSMIMKGIAHAEKFSDEAITRSLMNVYQSA